MTHDGGIVVGARQSTVFMVDAGSGKLLKKFDASTGTFEAVDEGDLTAADGLKVGEVDECIYVGEQEELEQPDHADRAAEVAAEGPSGEEFRSPGFASVIAAFLHGLPAERRGRGLLVQLPSQKACSYCLAWSPRFK